MMAFEIRENEEILLKAGTNEYYLTFYSNHVKVRIAGARTEKWVLKSIQDEIVFTAIPQRKK